MFKKTATHARTPTKASLQILIHLTRIHTALRPRCPAAGSLWSRSLDDVVKKLHGLHDVFILEGDEGFRSGGISAPPRQA